MNLTEQSQYQMLLLLTLYLIKLGGGIERKHCQLQPFVLAPYMYFIFNEISMATDISRGSFVSFHQGSRWFVFHTWGYRFGEETSMGYFNAVSKKQTCNSILKSTICIITQQESVHTGKICHLQPAVVNSFNAVCEDL
ncbi:hypothetical protein AMECASPLE_002555 [Ameca splendens]|uniref:Secreted protein n=1 Tax=Ameca splendens TaxID=208324 RepID=A0ABV0ZJZ4_9TELE